MRGMRVQTTLLQLATILSLAIAPGSCSSSGETTDGLSDQVVHDPGACGCHFEDGVLVISWECWCDQFDCTSLPPEGRCQNGLRDRIDYPACGLTTFRTPLLAGPSDKVYDGSGVLVGSSTSTDAGSFACPTDPSMKAAQMRAGVFPAASCEARTCAACSGTEAVPCATAASGS